VFTYCQEELFGIRGESWKVQHLWKDAGRSVFERSGSWLPPQRYLSGLSRRLEESGDRSAEALRHPKASATLANATY
jgi:hypothetical protein